MGQADPRKTHQGRMRILAAVALALLAACAGTADRALAPTGTLRAVFIGSNPVQGAIDAKTGEARGPAAEVSRALARRLGVPVKVSGLAGPGAVIEAVKRGEADIGFLAFDPARAEEVDYARPYAMVQATYIALASSPLRSAADVDRPGVRIGVAGGDSSDLFLSRTLKSAQITRNPGGNVDRAVQMLRAGEIDVYGANRQRLTEAAARIPDLRLFPDNFYGVGQAVVVARGNRALLDAVNRTIEEARASGLVAGAIARAGLKGVDVAP
jgi:polar amino acid transport system substrate-binding protein